MTGSWERADGEELDAAGMGGDPPCWAGIVEDHRDEDPDDGVDPVALPREPHLMSKATDGTSGQVVPKPGDGAVATEQDLSTRTQVDRPRSGAPGRDGQAALRLHLGRPDGRLDFRRRLVRGRAVTRSWSTP